MRSAGLAPDVELDLSIVSAGHGLVDAAALVGPYDATFSGVGSARLAEEAERLRIPGDLALRLSQPYKLGLLLLGTDYLRASTISTSWILGGPTIAFCSAVAARRLVDIRSSPAFAPAGTRHGDSPVGWWGSKAKWRAGCSRYLPTCLS